jgi:hypothetical protein
LILIATDKTKKFPIHLRRLTSLSVLSHPSKKQLAAFVCVCVYALGAKELLDQTATVPPKLYSSIQHTDPPPPPEAESERR